MSHVAKVDIEIQSLEDLGTACRRLGLELALGQTTYKWWGRHVGDYPVPQGFTIADLGICEHAIKVTAEGLQQILGKRPGLNPDAVYEIGVVKRRDGRPGYTLLWDFIGGGMGLQELVGPGCNHLKQAYGITAATRTMRAQGFTVKEVQQANGSIRLSCTK